MAFKDYLLNYHTVQTADDKNYLMVTMDTPEFGLMESPTCSLTSDKAMNKQLWDSLADDLVAKYEAKLKKG